MYSASAGAEKKIYSQCAYNRYSYLESVWVKYFVKNLIPHLSLVIWDFMDVAWFLLQILTDMLD